MLGEYNNSGQPLAEYVWLDDLPIALSQANAIYYIEANHLGTPRLITSAIQQVRWHWESAPFGDTLPNENPQNSGAFTFNLRFPGQYYDAESGLHYNYFRDYDPKTGRYIQSDPIGLEGEINTYAYVLDNPISFKDPLGLQAYTGQKPPENIPGGPWTPKPASPPGTFMGPEVKGQPRLECRFVPDASQSGGHKSAPESYWKVKNSKEPGWRYYTLDGTSSTFTQAHPKLQPNAAGGKSKGILKAIGKTLGGAGVITNYHPSDQVACEIDPTFELCP